MLTILLLAVGCNKATNNSPTVQTAGSTQQQTEAKVLDKIWPLTNAKDRMTKKTFGLYVTPQKSPVKPEKFRGYHTGVDFETTPEEKGVEVSVYAVCDGKILTSQFVSGYGGNIVQSCVLDGQDVTVIYGHLALASLPKTGAKVAQGDKIAVLGEVGKDTDNERKHLHLGIHKGTTIDFRGYVQKQTDLDNWIDFTKTSWYK